MIISILPILVTYIAYNDLYFEEEEKKQGVAWIPLLILGGVVIFFRVILEIGLRIGG
jgi:hypothetical protein